MKKKVALAEVEDLVLVVLEGDWIVMEAKRGDRE